MNCEIVSECFHSGSCRHKDVAEYCSIARDRKKGFVVDALVFGKMEEEEREEFHARQIGRNQSETS